MLSLYLRFVLPFIFLIHYIFDLTRTDTPSLRNQCLPTWHYLSEETLCIIFGRSQVGDVSWHDGSQACETNSAQLLTLTHPEKFQLVRKQINQLENNNGTYLDYFQSGAWIGEANWSDDDLCDGANTTNEDLQLNCILLTLRSNDYSLCLKRVLCTESHPFICESKAMTEEELTENTMERFTFWKCLVNVIWCVVDGASQSSKEKEKQKEQAAQAAEAASLQAYIDQFNFDLPKEAELDAEAQALKESKEGTTLLFGLAIPNWMVIGLGIVTFLLTICICCTTIICIFVCIRKTRSPASPANRDGSFDSTYSTVSR